MADPLPSPSGPPPRMTSQVEQSIPIAPGEVPEVQRFLEQMRAQKAMEAGGGNQDIAGITHEFMKRELRLIRHRAADMQTGKLSSVEAQARFLAILDEHIQALE